MELGETNNRDRALSSNFEEEESKGQTEFMGSKGRKGTNTNKRKGGNRPVTSNAFTYVPQPLTTKQIN